MAEELLPFGHGVMSGDPLPHRVVLWTRITIPDPRANGWDSTVVTDPQGFTRVRVNWVVATDRALKHVVRRGQVHTSAERDWTVKVDADHLPSATTLYYAFETLGYRSPIGRTRTAPDPTDSVTELTIAHIACTSWWQDWFNSYERIGERRDLDLVTHAGDHVYDSSGGHPASRFWKGQQKWDTDIDNADFRTVAECRRRYALYYADPALVRAHQAAPFAIMADQHDYDPGLTGDDVTLTTEQAGSVLFEWTPIRPPIPDGTGRFRRYAGTQPQHPHAAGPRRALLLPLAEVRPRRRGHPDRRPPLRRPARPGLPGPRRRAVGLARAALVGQQGAPDPPPLHRQPGQPQPGARVQHTVRAAARGGVRLRLQPRPGRDLHGRLGRTPRGAQPALRLPARARDHRQHRHVGRLPRLLRLRPRRGPAGCPATSR